MERNLIDNNLVASENMSNSTALPIKDEETAGENNKPIKKKSKSPIVIGITIAVIIIVVIIAVKVLVPSVKYSNAEKAFAADEYSEAMSAYAELGDYKDAAEKVILSEKAGHYQSADVLYDAGNYAEAYDEYKAADGYEDAAEKADLAKKAEHYQLADILYDAGNYAEAYDEYKAADGYEDAAEKADLAKKAEHYQSADVLYDAGNYAEAYDEYKAADDYEDAAEKIEQCANLLLENSDYESAGKIFVDIGNNDYANYCNAMMSFTEKEYEEAQSLFNKSNGIENAEEMANACILMQAEELWVDGCLNSAKELYQSLPEGFNYNGIDSASRINSLNAHSDFVNVCGQWKANDMDASVRQTHDSTGLWDEWYGDGEGFDYCVDIKCVINDDDTVSLTAKANFWIYTNYSTLSRNLKTSDWSATFEYTGNSLPSSLSLNTTSYSGDEITGSLKTSKGNYELAYSLKDANASVNFTYLYKAFGTYDTFVKSF